VANNLFNLKTYLTSIFRNKILEAGGSSTEPKQQENEE
jgi:hypothetical protein